MLGPLARGAADRCQGRRMGQSLPGRPARAFAGKTEFYAYVQWIAYGQWESLKKFAQEHGVGLMGDIPLGVSYYSADFFGNPEMFEPGWSGGAPPEPYFKDDAFTQKWGQNWGIPSTTGPRWPRTITPGGGSACGGVRDLFHVFRIDHILGFYRIYSFPWRPEQNAEFLPLSARRSPGSHRRTPAAVQAAGRRNRRRQGGQPRATARSCCAWCSRRRATRA